MYGFLKSLAGTFVSLGMDWNCVLQKVHFLCCVGLGILWKFPLGFFNYNRNPASNLLHCWTVMEMGCGHCWSEELPGAHWRNGSICMKTWKIKGGGSKHFTGTWGTAWSRGRRGSISCLSHANPGQSGKETSPTMQRWGVTPAVCIFLYLRAVSVAVFRWNLSY